MRLPTHAQVGALMQAADPSFKTFIALAAFAGLRLGEAAALQVGDIDFLRKKLDVVRQVQRANQGSVELRPPKCGSERTVFLAPELVELLASHIVSNGVGPEPTSRLFRGDGESRHTRTPLATAGARRSSEPASAGAGSTTLNTYSHLWPSAEDRTREATASLMSEVAGQFRATPGVSSLRKYPGSHVEAERRRGLSAVDGCR